MYSQQKALHQYRQSDKGRKQDLAIFATENSDILSKAYTLESKDAIKAAKRDTTVSAKGLSRVRQVKCYTPYQYIHSEQRQSQESKSNWRRVRTRIIRLFYQHGMQTQKS